MNVIRCNFRFGALWVLAAVLSTLTACNGMTVTPVMNENGVLLATPAQTGIVCESCDQATFAIALTQEKNNTNNQEAATAEIMRANAQATLNSANLTLNAALTQQQSDANFIAAQIAGTAEIVRANAQATLNSAGSTQVAALTQSQYALLSTQAVATQNAQAVITQQNKNDIAASTQTAISNTISTQTQSAVATSQWYTDQTRQREEQRQEPLAFLWMWCLPIFIILFAGLLLWGFWRWLKIQQANQLVLAAPVDRLQAPEIIDYEQDDSLPYLESDIVNSRYQYTKPQDQVDEWLDEVKNKLLNNDEKDIDDNTDN